MALLSPSDFLLLFPAEPQRGAPGGLAPPPADDPAAPLRASEPVTPSAMRREFAPYKLLSAVLAVNTFFFPWLSRSGVWRGALSTSSWAMLLAAVIVLNAEYFHLFELRQVIVGSIAVLYPWIMDVATYGFLKVRAARSVKQPFKDILSPGNGYSGPSPDQDVSGHLFSPLVRWLQALRINGAGPGGDSGKGSKAAGDAFDPEQPYGTHSETSHLLRHTEGDPLCPCATCLGNTPTLAAVLCLLDQSLFTFFPFVASAALGTYTPFVAFGSQFWLLWWCKLIAGIFFLFQTMHWIPTGFGMLPTDSVAMIRLTTRLRNRAVTAALTALVEDLERCLDGNTLADQKARDLYLVLHSHLRIAWKQRFLASRAARTGFVLGAANQLLAIFLNVVACSCTTAMHLLYLASFATRGLVVNLANYAHANAEIALVASSYRVAHVRIAEAAARAADAGRDVAPLKGHLRALEALAGDGAEYREKVLGVAVDGGFARSLVLGVLTLTVGLYSILRSAGVSVTMQVFCPSG